MQLMFTFPGQGAQIPGMLHRLPVGAVTEQRLSQASEVLQEDCLQLDSAQALCSTRSVQLCLLITGVVYASLLREQGISPDVTCGLSVGAFPAAVVAGALDYRDALQLVALRAQLMAEAYPSGYGLTAISGLDRWQVAALIEQVHTPVRPVYLANINGEQQMVIAGSDEAMQMVCVLAQRQGAYQCQRLAVGVPSHCALLTASAERLAKALSQVQIRRPELAYLSGSSGRLLWQPEQIAHDLAFNLARPVYWYEALLSAYQRGVRLMVEMPPGAVLTALAQAVMEQGEAVALEQCGVATVRALAARLAG